MPLVHIDLTKGRPKEKIEDMIRAVSQAIATSLDSPVGSVRVVVNEMEHYQYGVGGKPWPEVVAERRREKEGNG